LTDQEITHNLLLVLLAGHDTSSTTLTRAMSNLQVGSAGGADRLRWMLMSDAVAMRH
jgi:hypothetical protein